MKDWFKFINNFFRFMYNVIKYFSNFIYNTLIDLLGLGVFPAFSLSPFALALLVLPHRVYPQPPSAVRGSRTSWARNHLALLVLPHRVYPQPPSAVRGSRSSLARNPLALLILRLGRVVYHRQHVHDAVVGGTTCFRHLRHNGAVRHALFCLIQGKIPNALM